MKPDITAIGFDLFGVVIGNNPKGDPQMLKLITALRANGYAVGLLSNVDANHAFLQRYHDVSRYFDRVLLSSDIGVAKPNAQAYEHLAMQLNARTETTLYIDDHTYNVEGAQAAGLHGLLFKNYDQLVRELVALNIKIDNS
jgi:HAD superfamily hydrolase (TIGR01509 family)